MLPSPARLACQAEIEPGRAGVAEVLSPGALIGVTDQSRTVRPSIRRTAWTANRTVTGKPLPR